MSFRHRHLHDDHARAFLNLYRAPPFVAQPDRRGVQQARATERAWVERGEPLMALRIRIAQGVPRVGDIDDTRQTSRAEQQRLGQND